jgi:hypothetical protein
MYLISFLDKNKEEFFGTTEHFRTDGRYSFTTIHSVALDAYKKSLKREYITGYVIRKNSFHNSVIKTVTF